MRKDAVSIQVPRTNVQVLTRDVSAETYVPCTCKTACPTYTKGVGSRTRQTRPREACRCCECKWREQSEKGETGWRRRRTRVQRYVPQRVALLCKMTLATSPIITCIPLLSSTTARRGDAITSRWALRGGSTEVRRTQKDPRYVDLCTPATLSAHHARTEGITAKNAPREDGPRGLGDFQRRLNRDRPHDRRDRNRRDWDATPRSERSRRGEDAPSVRIPNASWDATPRRPSSPGGSSSNVRNRRWDAPTPRRGASPGSDEGEGALGLDAREWEEEQIRLDRDWYMGAEEGGVVGDEEYNPLAQYDDLAAVKEEQMAKKQVKKISARQAQYVRIHGLLLMYIR